MNTSTPTNTDDQTKRHTPNNENIFPTLHKKGKITKHKTMQETALKMTQKLTKMNYKDTGFLRNTTMEEKEQIITLSMYYQNSCTISIYYQNSTCQTYHEL